MPVAEPTSSAWTHRRLLKWWIVRTDVWTLLFLIKGQCLFVSCKGVFDSKDKKHTEDIKRGLG
jgi:hypothetical protein